MDGTLVDTEPYWIATEYELVESFGHEWSDEHAHAIVGFDLLDAAAYIAEHGGVPLPPREIVERLLDGVVARVREAIPWRPGARELLADLHAQGVPCALVTMSWRRFVEPVLEELPPGVFQVVVTGDEVAEGKPHPEPYLRAAADLGLDPADCVAIEDSPTGVRSAVAAGCAVLGVPNVRDIEPQPGVTILPSLEGLVPADLVALPTARDDAARGAASRAHEDAVADQRSHSPELATTDAERRPRPLGRRFATWDPRARRGVVLIGALLLAAVGLTAFELAQRDGPERIATDVPLDTWAPYWTLDATLDDLDERAPMIRELSPFWYRATGADQVGIDPNANTEAVEEFLDRARDAGVAIVPSIIDAMPAGGMAAVLQDPATRAVHVDTVVEFVTEGDFDGVDLDYEQFAFADGSDTWAATRPAWVAFVTELSARLRPLGKSLTVSIPPIYDDGRTSSSGYWVYDHGAIAEVVDHIRIMAYDFSTSSPGPIAPLDFVRRSVEGVASVVDDRSVLVLGIPTYGYNWPISVDGVCPADAPGRTSITSRELGDLLARRGGVPVRDDATGEWSFTYELEVTDGDRTCTQTRQVNYVDGDGAAERIDIAREAGFGGVALWALGYESDTAWDQIADVVITPPTTAAPAGQPSSTSGG
jgi:HAD superfamily hydrolase (TIGR01509 family)